MSITILFIIFATAYTANSQFSCKNASGSPVDWFVGYKLPLPYDTEYPGTTFYYADQHSTNWSLPENLNSSQSAINQTLSQYYESKGDQKTFYLLYNDDKPNQKNESSTRGHAKGVAVFGNDSGFWLIHSVPQFPPLERYFYVSNGKNNGQSFLCITMSTESIEVFAEAMEYVFPSVYHSQIPRSFVDRFSFLDYLQSVTNSSKKVRGKSLKKRFQSKAGSRSKDVQEGSLVQHFQSKAGYRFINFEKSGKYGSDLYSGLIAPKLQTSMYAETWLNGRSEDFPSLCANESEYQVTNIEEVNITGKNFTSSRDHSKWAVSANSTKPFVCIADINRQVSQTKRGGGAVCFKNENIWKMFQQSIVKLQKCGLTTKKTTKKSTKKAKTKTSTKNNKTKAKTKKKNNKVNKYEK